MQAVYGNFTRNPECFFEARSIPGSRRLIFTASGHHSITAGSLVLLDTRYGPDDPGALTRLTPEVCFPESEGRPTTLLRQSVSTFRGPLSCRLERPSAALPR